MGRSTEGFGGTSINTDPLARPKTPDIIDIIDDIISYFEEKMQVDGLPKGRYGVEADAPDLEPYIGDRKAAREFVIGKIQEFVNAEFEAKHR